jgi:two-component system CheB/CheR fusion protein
VPASLREAGPRVPRRVLVVEDNDDAAESMRLLLELQGHEVQVERTGSEAVPAAEAHPPEIVLCDIGPPGGMDGYAVASALKHDPALDSTTSSR